jgi:DNA-binding NtrC family response regulator
VFDGVVLNAESDNSGSKGKSSTMIFVVDDEPMVLELAAMIIQQLGFNVRTFRDPKKLLEEFPAAKPALVVTDYAMGEMTGLEVIRECKRVNPRQKVLLMSGTVDRDIFAGEYFKPDAFLAKPFQVKELVETVQILTKD